MDIVSQRLLKSSGTHKVKRDMFLLPKMLGPFAQQKLLTFFAIKKSAVFLHTMSPWCKELVSAYSLKKLTFCGGTTTIQIKHLIN